MKIELARLSSLFHLNHPNILHTTLHFIALKLLKCKCMIWTIVLHTLHLFQSQRKWYLQFKFSISTQQMMFSLIATYFWNTTKIRLKTGSKWPTVIELNTVYNWSWNLYSTKNTRNIKWHGLFSPGRRDIPSVKPSTGFYSLTCIYTCLKHEASSS